MGILWQIKEHMACIIAFVWDTILFFYDQFIVGNVGLDHFLCLSVLERENCSLHAK